MSLTRAFVLIAAIVLGTEACCLLTHVSVVDTQIRPYINGKPALRVGGTTQFLAEARGDGPTPCVIYDSAHDPQSFRWNSTDTTVLQVSNLGVVTARGRGEAMIIAETKGLTGEFTLTVVP
jgi:hypothetical protein